MKDENILIDLSMDLAVEILGLVKILKANHETVVANQIGRSGTSVGANIHEAQYAQSRADFISKFEIALKEANETSYWLKVLYKTNQIDVARFKKLDSLCSKIKVVLIASCKTAKDNK